MVDNDGRFHIADKGPAMNCLVGFGGFLYDRPVYSFGHFFKTIFYDACCSPRDYFELWKDRQRLQIALGDSNMLTGKPPYSDAKTLVQLMPATPPQVAI